MAITYQDSLYTSYCGDDRSRGMVSRTRRYSSGDDARHRVGGSVRVSKVAPDGVAQGEEGVAKTAFASVL